ncbi:MAG: alpha/beta hydrolase [Planctomycetaceae bacterium]
MSTETRITPPPSAADETGCGLSCFGSGAMPADARDSHAEHTAGNCTANSTEAVEPCPSPMSWVDVVQRLRTDSAPWEISCGSYSIAGRTIGTGKPLYFLGGATGDSDLFALTAWLLKDEFRCVLYDYPDHSARNHKGRPLTIDDYADDLLAVIEDQHDEQIVAYAVSLGVPVLLTAMQRHPERIGRAIVQGGRIRLPLTGLERLMLRCGRLLPGKLRHLPGRETIWKQNHRAWFPPFDFSRWNFFADVTGDVALKTLAHRLSLMHQTDLRHVAGQLSQPVLIIGTEGEGPRLAAQRQALEQALPFSRTELLDTTGLVPFLTHPHRLKKMMRPFLTCEELLMSIAHSSRAEKNNPH